MATGIGAMMVRKMIEQYERASQNTTPAPKDNETESCKNGEKEE